MGLEQKLLDDMKTAMKSGDKIALETLRMVRAQAKNAMISKGKELSEDEMIEVLSREVKKRKESLDLFEKGGRADLVSNEKRELEIIQSYLPKALNEEELRLVVKESIEEIGAQGLRDMGKVMGAAMPKLKGRADGKAVQEMVKAMLA